MGWYMGERCLRPLMRVACAAFTFDISSLVRDIVRVIVRIIVRVIVRIIVRVRVRVRVRPWPWYRAYRGHSVGGSAVWVKG